jgi:hypothetical protein
LQNVFTESMAKHPAPLGDRMGGKHAGTQASPLHVGVPPPEEDDDDDEDDDDATVEVTPTPTPEEGVHS